MQNTAHEQRSAKYFVGNQYARSSIERAYYHLPEKTGSSAFHSSITHSGEQAQANAVAGLIGSRELAELESRYRLAYAERRAESADASVVRSGARTKRLDFLWSHRRIYSHVPL